MSYPKYTLSLALKILDSVFQKGSLPKGYKHYKDNIDKRTRVVLLDELDYLITKDQTLLYNLFDWTQHRNSKLVMIGIANTMDLKQSLQPKIQSRMGDRNLVYKPYTSQQIETILMNRLEGIEIIHPETLRFLAKKIATFSSDIRRTLHVCR
jgi:origin recognition complex subunit 1